MAQKAQFYTIVSETEISVGDKLEVAFVVENGDISKFNAPAWSDKIQYLYGPNTSSNYEVINGKMSSSKTYSFIFKAIKPGKIQINGATAYIDGKLFKSNSIAVNIVEKEEEPQNNGPTKKPSNNNDLDDDEDQKSIEDQIRNNIIIKGFVDKNSVKQGQQISLTFKVFYKIKVDGLQIFKNPSFKNFFAYEMEIPQSLQEEHEERYNGELYYSQTFLKTALFPIKAGKFTIEPMELIGQIPIMIGPKHFQIQDSKDIKIKSESITINVEPLGGGDVPLDFCGGIGKFSIQSSFDKSTLNVGDPITYIIKIRGNGNLKLIDVQQPNFPKSFQVYRPKIKEEISTLSGTVIGTKTYEYLLLPQTAGSYQLPAYSISYFDTETNSYKSISFPETEITVNPSLEKDIKEEMNAKNQKKDRAENEIDDNYIENQKGDFVFFGSKLFYFLITVPFLLFIAFVFKRRHKAANSNLGLNVNKIDDYNALENANINIQNNNKDAFYKSIQSAIFANLFEKTKHDFILLDKQTLKLTLESFGISQEDTTSILNILLECETGLYSLSSKANDMEALLLKTKTLFVKLDLQKSNHYEK